MKYVKGMDISTLNEIEQLGGRFYNEGKEGHRVSKVTDEKRKVIIEALRYYQMI